MTIEYREWIWRKDVIRERDKLFVFGDNMKRTGKGGQAYEIRGEPNAIGIPTKWLPSCEEKAFFTDEDYSSVIPILHKIEKKLELHVFRGGVIIWPKAGIGTGLAELESRSPMIWEAIERMRKYLEQF